MTDDAHVVYSHVFGSEYGKEVFADLCEFCFFEKSYLDTAKKLMMSEDGKRIVGVSPVDALELARFEGRREVFLFIKNMMKKQEKQEEIENDDDYT